MAISEDTANQPATATTTGAWTGTGLSTAAFSPVINTLVVALLLGNLTSSANGFGTVTDSASGQWMLLDRMDANSAVGVVAEVWARWCPAAPGSITVKAVGSANALPGAQLTCRSLLGAQQNQTGRSGKVNNTAAAAMQAAVAAATGNWVYGIAQNWTAAAAMTALANTTVITATADSGNGDEYEAFKSTAATAGPATYGFSTSTQGSLLAVEILAAGTATARTARPNVIQQATMIRASTR